MPTLKSRTDFPVSVLIPPGGVPIRSLREYQEQGGLEGLTKARATAPENVIAEVKKAGLRGRGGAGFPTAVKWEGVRSDPSKTKYFVCNGSEGEPGTFKDRYLIRKNPYQLVEGMLIAAYAIGVAGVFIGLKAKFNPEMARLRSAIAEFDNEGLLKPGFIEVVPGPDEYLFGEEKALLEVIDGRGAMPRILPPYMQGARYTPTSYNPTVVNNVESTSHVAHILAKGADWFRSLGTDDTPGTMIFTLCGDVKNQGMYELPLGLTMRELLEDIGGGSAHGKPFKAVFSGVTNRVMTPDQFDTPLAFGSLRSIGCGLGSGGFIVFDEDVCMVKAALTFSAFLAEESCGQCVPCKTGNRNITDHLQKIQAGMGTSSSIKSILQECGKVTNQSRCFLPAEESILISSVLEKFPQEFQEHLQKTCLHPRSPELWKINDFNEKTGQFVLQS